MQQIVLETAQAATEQLAGSLIVAQKANGNRWSIAIGAVALPILTLLFLGQYWNHFLAMRTGFGSSLIAQFMAEGKLPYRDFFLMVPPLQFLKTSLIVNLFGNQLIVPYIFAVIERLALGLLLYFWLIRHFRASDSFFATLVALMMSFGDGADMMTSYNHAPTIIWIVAAGFAVDASLHTRSRSSSLTLALVAGLCAGICFGMKQTLGIGVTLTMPFIVTVLKARKREWRGLGKFLALFTIGWIGPAAGLLLWLQSHGVLRSYLEMTYGSGIQGKGSPAQILLRPILLTLSRPALLVSVLIGASLVAVYWFASRSKPEPPDERTAFCRTAFCRKDTDRQTAFYALLGAGAIGLAILTGMLDLDHIGWTRELLMKGVIYVVLAVTLAQNIHFALVAFRGPLTQRQESYWILAGVSFAVAFTLCLSWPAFEPMVFPGLAFITAIVLRRFDHVRNYRYATLAFGGFLIYSQLVGKIETPFVWDGWPDAPVRAATVEMKNPLLRGFRFPKETADFAEHVTEVITTHSTKSDTVYIYPGLVVFYLLADRRPPTFAYDHTMDIGPDWLCRQDARRLLDAKPAVILEYTPPLETIEDKEAVWRGGKPSGQRDLLAAIRTLTVDYKFHETLTPRGGGRLDIWASN